MSKYGLHGKLVAKRQKGQELADILLKASKLLSSSKGCRFYIVSIDNNDNDSVWVTEVWDCKEDHDESLKSDGVRSLISQAMPLLNTPPEKGQVLEVKGGLGI